MIGIIAAQLLFAALFSGSRNDVAGAVIVTGVFIVFFLMVVVPLSIMAQRRQDERYRDLLSDIDKPHRP